MNDFFETKDKQITPYLLTQSEIQYHGVRVYGQTIYFLFSPKEIAQELANRFMSRQAKLVEPKNLLEAVETYRDVIFEMKEKRRNYELPHP